MGRLVNSVGCLLPRPSQDLQQPPSCSHAPAGIGGLTCYSSVTSQDWLLSWLGTVQHPSPSPPRTPLHSVLLVATSCLVTAWQGDRGGDSSTPYLIPFSLSPSSLSSTGPPLSFTWALGWGLGLGGPLPFLRDLLPFSGPGRLMNAPWHLLHVLFA